MAIVMIDSMPTPPVVFGKGALEMLGDKIKEFNVQKPMICYDPGIRDCGIGPRAVEIIKNAGFDPVIYEDVIPECPCKMVDEMTAIARDNEVDLLIGLGGGSALDAAKAVAFMCKHEGPSADYIEKMPDFIGLPTISIPTTSGTGSEVSLANVLSDPEREIKGAVVYGSALAILDPELTVSAPKGVTALCGMDALAHACEALTSKMANPKSDIIGAYAIEKIIEWLPICLDDLSNMEAREELQLASNFAGMAFNNAFIHFGHAFAETIGPHLHIHHGMVCALSVPATLEFVGDLAEIGRIKKIAAALHVDISDIADDGHAIGMRVADRVREFMRTCGVPSFKAQGFERDDLLQHCEEMVGNFHMGATPVEVTVEIARKYTARAYDGYIEE